MTAPTLTEFLASPRPALATGPIALIFAEDQVELDSTLRHRIASVFKATVLFAPDAFNLAPDIADDPGLYRVAFDLATGDRLTDAVNAMIEAAPGVWMVTPKHPLR